MRQPAHAVLHAAMAEVQGKTLADYVADRDELNVHVKAIGVLEDKINNSAKAVEMFDEQLAQRDQTIQEQQTANTHAKHKRQGTTRLTPPTSRHKGRLRRNG